MLPNFLIVGPPKCASTSLHYYLGQHPEIYTSKIKEINFFTLNYYKGIEFYEKHFMEAGEAKLRGEATPSYSFLPFAAARIKETIPDIKLIFCFRNPTDRAFSHWLMLKNAGVEKVSFSEAIEINKKQLNYISFTGNEGADLWNNRSKNVQKGEKWIRPYLHPGMYAQSLNLYFELFDKNNIQILFVEDLKNNFDGTLKKIFNFLDVNSDFIVPKREEQNFSADKKLFRSLVKIIGLKNTRYLAQFVPADFKKKIRPSKKLPEKPEMSKQDRLSLWQLYMPDILELEKITERNLNHWAPK